MDDASSVGGRRGGRSVIRNPKIKMAEIIRRKKEIGKKKKRSYSTSGGGGA